MKNKRNLIIACLVIILFSNLAALAQSNSDVDKEIAELEARKEKLLKLKALREETKRLEEELKTGNNGSGNAVANPAHPLPPQQPPQVVNNSGSTVKGQTETTVIAATGPLTSTAADVPGGTTALPATASNTQAANANPSPIPAATEKKADTPPPVDKKDTFPSKKCLEANDNDANKFSTITCDLASELVVRKSDAKLNTVKLSLAQDQSLLMKILFLKMGGSSAAETLSALEKKEAPQNPGDARSSGSSLIQNASIPKFLSLAIENGAVQSVTKDTTISFRANPGNVLKYLAGYANGEAPKPGFNFLSPRQQIRTLFDDEDPVLKQFNKMSIGLSFDISRGVEVPQFTGSREQLSAVSFTYNLLDRRNPLNPRYRPDWEEFLGTAGVKLNDAATKVFNKLVDTSNTAEAKFYDPLLQAWLVKTNALLEAAQIDISKDREAAKDVLAKVLDDQIKLLPATELSKIKELIDLRDAGADYTAKRKALIEKIDKGEIVSFQFTNYRDPNEPDLSNFKALVSKKFLGNAELNLNGSLTLFHKETGQSKLETQATFKRLRDFDFGLEIKLPLGRGISEPDLFYVGENNLLSRPLLTFSGKYQRLLSDAFLPDGSIKPGTKGDILFGQIRLQIPINFNGFKFTLPFSFSFSNRQELIKENKVFGGFGTMFDFNPFGPRLLDLLKLPEK